MRKLAVLFMAALMPLSLVTAGASASPPSPYLEAPGMATLRADALTAALDDGRISEAQYALHRARSLAALGAVRSEFGDVARPEPHDATLFLRDLALRLRSLSGEDRSEAAGLLARPTQGGENDGILEYNTAEGTPVESSNFVVHYVTTGEHKSEATYVAAVSAIMEEVWNKEVTQMGWRAPKSDAGAQDNGGNAKFDVYLGNIGGDGYYGYCAPDSPQSTIDQHAYCVLDNDFRPEEFGNVINRLTAASVTAAHEFNHAIQFAYDVTDDGWLLEATATWMEDEVYNDINDNYQYLPASPLGRPQTPADTWTSDPGPEALFQYGTFVWMTFLSEQSNNPSLIRRIWEKTAETNVYSVEAIEAVIGDEALFADSFNKFAAWNSNPAAFYSEGAAYEAKVAPVRSDTHTIAPGTELVDTQYGVDHLSSRAISFKPGFGVGANDQMTIAVNMGTAPMQEASVVLVNGATKDVRPIPLTDGKGNLTVTLGGQEEVVLVLSNASNRNAGCARDGWRPGTYSCGGAPSHDNQGYAYSAAYGQTAPEPGQPADVQAPVLSGLQVKPNPVRRGRTANVSFTIDDAAAIKLIILRSGRKVMSGNVSGVNAPGEWTIPVTIGKKIPTGKYSAKIVATDTAGNKSSKKKSFRIVK